VLASWSANHARLEPVLAASPRAREARSLSRDLSALGALGLEALDAVRAGRARPPARREASMRLVDQAAKPRAEVEIAVVPALRKLVLAAAELDQARTMSLEEWNRRLDERLKPPGAAPSGH
jgi:hexosaminidase